MRALEQKCLSLQERIGSETHMLDGTSVPLALPPLQVVSFVHLWG